MIDPRGPRVAAGITAVVVLVVIGLALAGQFWPAFILFAAQGIVFAVGAFAGVQRHPYGVVFRKLIRPRLTPPLELEDAKPPTFAQGVGLVVTVAGLGLGLLVPLALPIAAAAAFIAAFLNSVFDYCLGCQIYLLLVRTKVIKPA
jgi:hypothetical protein